MAVRTSDFIVNLNDFTTEGLTIDAKKKTAIRINDLSTDNVKDLDMQIVGNTLEISYQGKKLVVSNYTSLKYIKTEYEKIGKKEYYDLFNIIDNNAVKNTNPITYNSKKLTVSGTNYNDKIDLSLSSYTPIGVTNIKKNKGITFDGKHGSDILVGTDYNDVFKGGNGDDVITGGEGADTITGGTGENIINYDFSINSGKDIINLTKGENFVLNIDGVNVDDLNFKYSSNNKDLIIYTTDDKSVTLKNFASKDVTNNATKKTINSSSVIITDGTNDIDLRNDFYLIGDDNKIKIDTKKNFSGTWLHEEIDASSYIARDKKGNELLTNTKGLTLKGNNGNDVIVGSKYNDNLQGGNGINNLDGYIGNDKITGGKENDTITGGLGNDIITGGAGENIINYDFSVNSGKDIITLTKGENFVLNIDGANIDDLNYKYSSNNKDLIIYTTDNKSVTLKNFASKDITNNANAKKKIDNSSSVIITDGTNEIDLREDFYLKEDSKIIIQKNYNGSWLNEEIDATSYTRYVDKKKTIIDKTWSKKGLSINGKDGNDIIQGSNYSDTIKGGNGDDTIYSGSGNDKIDGETGKNTIIVKKGDGHDTLYASKGEDTIIFKDIKLSDLKFEKVKNNLLIYYDFDSNNNNNSSLCLYDYYKSCMFKQIEDESGLKLDLNLIAQDRKIITFVDTDNVMSGTENNDIIKQIMPADIINAGAGDDIIYCDNGDKTIYGGRGNDLIFSGNGINTIYGDTGNDTLIGGNEHNDYCFVPGSGHDVIVNNNGIANVSYKGQSWEFKRENNNLIIIFNSQYSDSVTLLNYFTNSTSYKYLYTGTNSYNSSSYSFNKTIIAGNEQSNEITINYDSNYVFAGAGDDIIQGYTSNNGYTRRLYGEEGNDTIIGGKDRTYIYGGSGDDYMISGDNQNYLYDEEGNDIYYINSTLLDKNEISDFLGNDTLIVNAQKENFNLFFNVSSNGNHKSDLILLWKNNSSRQILIKDFTQNGMIENIIFNNTTEEDKTDDISIEYNTNKINQIIENVTSWLLSNGYNDVQTVIDSGNADDINALTTYFTQDSNWSTPST